MITTAAFLLGVAFGVALRGLYLATRPKGSPWHREVRKWWGQNEDLIEVERRRAEEISRRDFEKANTPPHREGGRYPLSAALRQPGAGSEGRDAATSDRYRSALVLDENVRLDSGEMRNADLAIRYFRDDAHVIKDRYGVNRYVSMGAAEALLARSDIVLHRGEAADR